MGYFKFCDCGRVHYIEKRFINWLNENKKENYIINTCLNCGQSVTITVSPENNDIQESPTIPTIIYPQNNHCTVFLGEGFKIPMMNGGFASEYTAGRFFDPSFILDPSCDPFHCEHIDPKSAEVDVSRISKYITNEDILEEFKKLTPYIGW